MNKYLLLGLLGLLPFSAGAQQQDEKNEISITGEVVFASSYVYRGVNRADESLQPGVKIEHAGVYAGIWGNLPIQSRDRYDPEGNIYVGYIYDRIEVVNIDVGYTYYEYGDLNRFDLDYSSEVHLGVFKEGQMFEDGNLFGRAYAFYNTTQEGFIVEGAVGYGHTFRNFPQPIGVIFTLYGGVANYNDFQPHTPGLKDAENRYAYYGVSMEVPVDITDDMQFFVGGAYGNAHEYELTLPSGAKLNWEDAVDNNLWWRLGMRYSY